MAWHYLLPLVSEDDVVAEVIPDAETIAGPIEPSALAAPVRAG